VAEIQVDLELEIALQVLDVTVHIADSLLDGFPVRVPAWRQILFGRGNRLCRPFRADGRGQFLGKWGCGLSLLLARKRWLRGWARLRTPECGYGINGHGRHLSCEVSRPGTSPGASLP
jgi:hypothetical protein